MTLELLPQCCGNCKHWDQMEQEEASHIGLCLNTPKEGTANTKGGRMLGANMAPKGRTPMTIFGVSHEITGGFRPVTLNLALCTKWQEKSDASPDA